MMFWRKNSHKENGCVHQFQADEKVNELRVAMGRRLTKASEHFCTDACLKRYLEARNWDVDKAMKMLEETTQWRSTFKPDSIRWNDIAIEGETGKAYRANFFDRQGRTVLILRPGMQNTTGCENQMRHLVYLLENAIYNLPKDQEQMAWLIDFTGWSMSNAVPVKTSRETINILQNHYPERLAVAFLYNPPRIFEASWKIVKYFLDAKTFAKVKFVYPKNKDSVELMKTYFDDENLPAEFGGRAKLHYDHEEFSRLMNEDEAKTEREWKSENSNGHINNGKPEVCHESAIALPAS
ncbi:hypothetical protein MKX03_012764 [Papaver bracteatum]|nr:hypothetical protein MKX03_012764 [Papaver bracteatum]